MFEAEPAVLSARPSSSAPPMSGVRMTEPKGASASSGPPANKELVGLMSAVAEKRSREAFAGLFEHFAPRVKSFIMRAGAAPDVAEELAQETMLMVWRKAASFDASKAAVSTWVFTIARNKRIDRLRRENRPEIDPEDLKLDSETPDPAAAVSALQNRSILETAIKDLTEDQARVIRMAFYEDKSHSAIAEELGLPLGTVKSRIRLALGRLRTMVEQDEV